MLTLRSKMAIAALAICSAKLCLAGPAGTLNIANCNGGGITLDATHITWLPNGTLAGTGCVNTGAGTNVISSLGGLGPGATGNIKNLIAGNLFPVDEFMFFVPPAPVLDFAVNGFAAIASTNGTN